MKVLTILHITNRYSHIKAVPPYLTIDRSIFESAYLRKCSRPDV